MPALELRTGSANRLLGEIADPTEINPRENHDVR